MKLKLNLTYRVWDLYDERKLAASTIDAADYDILVKTVTVEIPDNIDLTETEFNNAIHLKALGVAEEAVKVKRDELYRAEEVVKNMLALPAEII